MGEMADFINDSGDPDESGHDDMFEPDWTEECIVCGWKPILPLTGMCGPCTWGEAETMGGNW